MKKCCVCRNAINSDEPAILFIGQAGDEKEICPICEKNYEVLMESENPAELKEAINYLYTCSLSSDDNEVTSFLKETIDANSSIVAEMESRQKKSKPIDMSKKQDYFSDRQSESGNNQGGSIWISIMKTVTWISFFAIIIAGIVLAVIIGQESAGIGFLIFLISVVAAFLSVAGMMIFLDMARDLSEIKATLKNKKK